MYNTNYRILIVDDVEENLQVVGSILGENMIAISLAKNGAQAIKIAQKKLPDLILLDINMPDMDGYETCEILKNDERTKDIPVIFLSAFTEKDDIIKGFEYGGVDYITKPFNKDELLSRVFTHMELQHVKNKISEQNKKLLELNATKDKFFSILAHDLKNPFNTIIGFSELLLQNFDEISTKEQKEYIGYIQKSGKETFKLLENLLLWARSQKGILEYKPKKENLNNIVKEIINLSQVTATAKNINLLNNTPEEIFVKADKEMLLTIIRNLISNAIKYTPKGGTIIISANTNKNADFIEICVQDNGIGISAEKQSQLFKMTEGISTEGTEKEKGTGLGLILCKEFVDKHNGDIWVENNVDKGTSVKFLMPKY